MAVAAPARASGDAGHAAVTPTGATDDTRGETALAERSIDHTVIELHDGGAYVSAETSARLACDASVVLMHHAADGTVLVDGCAARRCDAHHLEHWLDGGATSLDNLTLLCRRHHRLVHEGGIYVSRSLDGAIAFHRVDGRRVEVAPAAPSWRDSQSARGSTHLDDPLAPSTDRLARVGIAITSHTAPCWDGTPFNAGYVIDVLREHEPLGPSPESSAR